MGKNLSHVLLLYLNDLENRLSHNPNASIIITCDDEHLSPFMKLSVWLFADDTVLIVMNCNVSVNILNK